MLHSSRFVVFVSLVVLGAFSGKGFAADRVLMEGVYSTPMGAASGAVGLNPASIKITQWNVHMYATIASAGWGCSVATGEALELCRSLAGSDLALVQEANHAGGWRDRSDALLGLGSMHLAYAPYAVNVGGSQENFHVGIDEKIARGLIVRDPARNGSATFSRVAPLSTTVRYSRNADNFWDLYMPLLATTYALEGRGEKLLVVHIHNLAGTGSDRQLELLDEAEQLIAAHRGPVLFSGDFNSATVEKMENLNRLAARQGLAEIRYHSPFATPFGARQLDHTYVRGLALKASSVRVFADSQRLSDHRAIAFELAAP